MSGIAPLTPFNPKSNGSISGHVSGIRLGVSMNELIEDVSRDAQELQTDVLRRMVELGNWMGRREAFGLMAGRCSAADAECLRRMRDDRSYRDLNCSWEDFCTT